MAENLAAQASVRRSAARCRHAFRAFAGAGGVLIVCGIAGAVSLTDRPLEGQSVATMVDRLRHRGPDDGGLWRDDRAAFGFRRLSFLDLAGGNQPLWDERRRVVAICNGEIYNYRDLRKRLQARGHTFSSGTDVEVIVHLFEEHGPDLVDHLEGQFALAVLDTWTRELVLARDPFGVCPLYYTVVDGELIFASEIKALLEDGRVSRVLDLTALDQVMTFPGVISPRTLFSGISSLPAGHLLVPQCGQLTLRRYWDLNLPLNGEWVPLTESEAVTRLEAALDAAVRPRLHADVSIGCYVSGGLDSAVIAHLADRIEGDRRYFSISFLDPTYDESLYQSVIAGNFATAPHNRCVTAEDVDRLLPSAVWHSECPLKESYNVASLVLSAAAREHGAIGILTGEGADELFAGYVGHRFDLMRHSRPPIPLAPEERELRERVFGDPDVVYEKDYVVHRESRRSWYASDLAASLEEFDCTREPAVAGDRVRGRHHLDQRCYLDFHLRLVDHLVADHGDRMTMANSVEGRYPFLDKAVAELAASMQPELKLRGMTEKYILRQVARRLGVPEVVTEREKFHFVAPSSAALLQSGSALAHELLSPDAVNAHGVFDAGVVRDQVERASQRGFYLDLPYEDDVLMVVLTTGSLIEQFGIKGAA